MPAVYGKEIKTVYQETGSKVNPTILLMMGAGAQMIFWPDSFFYGLAEKGYRVIRYDYRDTGLSSKFETAGKPKIGLAFLQHVIGLPVKAPYTLEDMADDAATLFQALGIAHAHIVGCSMGGMIAQIFAAKHRELTSTITVMMSHTNSRRLPKVRWKILRHLIFNQPEADNREALIRYCVKMLQLAGSPAYPTPVDELREMVERQFDRSNYPVGVLRHIAAAFATGDIRHYTRQVTAPGLIIHGRDDPLLRPEAGIEIAMSLSNATIRIYNGMGHDLPQQLVPAWIDIIDAHIRST